MCGASLQSEDVEMQQAMDELLDSLNVKEPAARAAMSNMPKEKKLQMIIEHQLMKKSESQLPKKKKIRSPHAQSKKKKKHFKNLGSINNFKNKWKNKLKKLGKNNEANIGNEEEKIKSVFERESVVRDEISFQIDQNWTKIQQNQLQQKRLDKAQRLFFERLGNTNEMIYGLLLDTLTQQLSHRLEQIDESEELKNRERGYTINLQQFLMNADKQYKDIENKQQHHMNVVIKANNLYSVSKTSLNNHNKALNVMIAKQTAALNVLEQTKQIILEFLKDNDQNQLYEFYMNKLTNNINVHF